MLNKKTFSLLAVLIGLAFSFSAFAQNVSVSGTVSDARGPIARVTVYVPGSTESTVTDFDGNFNISVPSDAVLQFSALGYQLVREPVNGRLFLNVTLKPEEVVQLGYGAQTLKKNLTGAVSHIDDFENLTIRPVASIGEMLQGQVAGVVFSTDDGAPTGEYDIKVRGAGSINGDNVLWVVDGVPGKPISMTEIESLDILKDAATAALYGAKAGTAIFMVTTKKTPRKGFSVNYEGIAGVRHNTRHLTPLTAAQQVDMRVASYKAAGWDLGDEWNPDLHADLKETNTYWMEEVVKPVLYQRHNASVTFNSDNFTSRLAILFNNNQGTVKGVYNKDLRVRYYGEYTLNDYMKMTEDLAWSSWNRRVADSFTGSIGSYYLPILEALHYNPNQVLYDEEGKWIRNNNSLNNPVYVLRETADRCLRLDGENDVWSTTRIQLANFLRGFEINGRFSYNIYQNLDYTLKDDKGVPTNNKNTVRRHTWKTDVAATFDRTFGLHDIDALLVWEADRTYGRGFASNKKDWFETEDANIGLIARAAYAYADRYFVSASWRRDYGSRLFADRRFSDSPAVSAAWKISSEPFFPKTEAVNLLKIRASWGRTGDMNSLDRLYRHGVLDYANWADKTISYGAEGELMAGYLYYNRDALNTMIMWERSQQFDLGLDLFMFSNRLNLTVDFYDKKTFDILQKRTKEWTSSIGLFATLINSGVVNNRGAEITLGWNDKVGNWSYYVNGNYAYNKNWISDIGTYNPDGTKGVWSESGSYRNLKYVTQSYEGGALNQFYLVECLGIFQSPEEVQAHKNSKGEVIQPDAVPGDLKFADFNDDGKITDKDRQYYGTYMPHSTFALNAGFTWKKLSASMMLQGVLGSQTMYVGKYSLYSDHDYNWNREVGILNAWSETNKNTDIPRLTKNDTNNNFSTASTWYLEDTSYLRIKNVTVGYDLTEYVRKAKHFAERRASLSIYASAENLFTFTKYSGLSPECGAYDSVRYPVSRVFSLGLKLNY